jgi:hypothetical protein
MKKYTIPAVVAGALCFVAAPWYCTSRKAAPTPVKKETVSAQVETASKPVCVPRKYVAVKGDSLWKIAEREYGGRGYLYPLLSEVNGLKNPNFIVVGQSLMIPCCLCDLPPLTKKLVITITKKTTTPKVKVAKVVAPIPVQSPVTQVEKVVVTPTPAPATPKVDLVQAPRPPPVAVVPTPTLAQTQTQNVVVVNVQKQPAPAPTPQPVAPQQTPLPTPAPKETPKAFVPPPAKPVAEVKPPVIPIPPQPKLVVGSLWNTAGQNPIEPRDFVDMFHVDTGVVIITLPGKIQVEPYIGFNTVKDTKGYSWNNRVEGEAGIKFVRPFSHGVVEFGGAYAAERRFGTGSPSQTKTGVIGFTNGWFGWQQPTRHAAKRKILTGALPGTFQWRIGNISPFERNNLIGWMRMDQGFTLAKVKGVSLIPTTTFIETFDTDGNPWNRRYSYGGGLKVAIPWKTGTVSVQGGYMCAKQYSGAPMAGANNCGPSISLDFWTGARRRIGGN